MQQLTSSLPSASKADYQDVFIGKISHLPLSPNLQSRKRHHRKQHAKNIKPDHHLRFVPASLFEMMMDWSHRENPSAFPEPFSCVAKITRLQNDQPRHHHEHSSGDGQDERLMNQYRHQSQTAPQRQRP